MLLRSSKWPALFLAIYVNLGHTLWSDQNVVLGGGDLESTCMHATSTRRSVIDIIDI